MNVVDIVFDSDDHPDLEQEGITVRIARDLHGNVLSVAVIDEEQGVMEMEPAVALRIAKALNDHVRDPAVTFN